jgi:ATP-dependent DNA helicase RecQ
MNESIQTHLKHHFGHAGFRPGQERVIEHLLNGRSAAAVFPTGGGKSICYQLPALLLPGVTLVVSPLIALMKDQIDALTARGIAAGRLDSTLDAEAYRGIMDRLREGRLRLLYVAPERFNNERFRESIRNLRVSLFAVDEAHCLSEWGHNFRPDYLKLTTFARQIGAERILALTATATPRVLEDICRVFDIADECAVRTGFYRPNLELRCTPLAAGEKDRLLLEALAQRAPGPTIVYVTLQQSAEELARHLADAGWPARAYHAGMEDDDRAEVQEWFMALEQALVVATIAFGMGVDKANIRYVYHYNPPKSLENYAQEIGRAGRDGAPSVCHLLFCADDLRVLENFIYGDTPDEKALHSLLHDLFDRDSEFALSLYETSTRHDIRPLVLRTLLTYLELDGVLQGGTPFYSLYKFKPLQSSSEILGQFEGERRHFLESLFRQVKKGRIWLSLDPATAASALGCPRSRIVRALDWLSEQGMLELQASGVRHRYRRLASPLSLDRLAASLHQRMMNREAGELGRLRQVRELALMEGCRHVKLADHFGERLEEPCGHCSGCRGEHLPLPEAANHTIPEALSATLGPLLAETGDLFDAPRVLSRFLCGISSPKLSRAKLGGHRLFGSLAEIPFAHVMAWAEKRLAQAPTDTPLDPPAGSSE